MKNKVIQAKWLGWFFFLIPSVFAQKYDGSVWETHRYSGNIQSIQFTKNIVYVFCDYGIYQYDRFYRVWLPPITKNPVFGFQFLTKQPTDKPTLIDNFTLGLFQENRYYEYNSHWNYWIERAPPNLITGPDSVSLVNEDVTRWIPPFGWTILPNKTLLAPYQRYYRINSAVTDERGDTWWNIAKLGLAMGNKITRKISFERLGPSENQIKTITYDPNFIYVGGTSRGLSRFNRKTGQWDWFEPLQSGFEFTSGDIRSIQLKSNSNWVLATAHGVVMTKGEDTKDWRSMNQLDGISSNDVKDVLVVEDLIFVASNQGIDVIEKDKQVKKILSFLPYTITVYRLTKLDSIVYAASSMGIIAIQMKGYYVAFLENPEEFSSYNWTYVKAYQNELWGMNSDGLAVYDRKSHHWTCWNVFHKFDGSRITSVSVHPQHIWVGSNNGLYRIDRTDEKLNNPQTLFSPRIHRYSMENDGLISNFIYEMEIDKDTLLIGTNNGLTLFRFRINGNVQE